MSSNDGPDPYGQSARSSGNQYGQQPGQAYGAPSYGQPGVGDGRPPKNGFGIAALVLGIVSIITSWILGLGLIFAIPGLILGAIGLGRVRKGRATNRGAALIGVITSVIGLILSIVVLVVASISIVAVLNNGGREAFNCLVDSGGDQVAVDRCLDTYAPQLEQQQENMTTDT